MPHPTDPSRDLLFGLLALQTGLIDQAALVAAFHAWTQDKARPLADHLVASGHLDAAHRPLLEGLAAAHLARHGGDVEKSLAAVPANLSARNSLAALGEPEIETTLARVARSKNGPDTNTEDDDRTTTYSVGSATSDGQRFRILRPYAKGGLGAVFVALDRELHCEVALKQILEEHADDPDSRRRFVAEAEITGGLEHPGVVPVYGLGTDADGHPYYAMRFIKGNSLKDAIARFHEDETLNKEHGRRSLELRKLLRRFTDVCNAIDYAHSRGVIHRDLKPANIIVGKHGETVVVDWGLAKAVGRADPSVGERSLAPSSSGSSETVPGSALGTPAYMSPEQARGELDRLGPRSDVYSPGATLHCLLTGKPPFQGDDIGVILRAVQEGQLQRPSQHQPTLDKALDAVCLKAMATRPEDRYPTPRALADDLDRWMADEPVTAWREPFSRRARRWAWRNRTAVTAALVAMLAVVVGLGAVTAVQARGNSDLRAANREVRRVNTELAAEKTRVQGRYDLAMDAIKTFHTGASEDFLLKQDQFRELRDRLLKSAAEFYGALGALLGEESDVASRRALYQANFELAGLTAKVGRQEEALAAHRAVLAAREALAAEPGADAGAKTDVGRSLTAVARLLEATGHTDEAILAYRKAEERLAPLADPSPAAAPARAALAFCRAWLGWLLQTTGHSEEGLAVLRLARSEQEALAATPGATTQSRRELADTVNNISGILLRTGKQPEAELEYRAALLMNTKLADENPAVSEFRSEQANSHWNLGSFFAETGKPTEAVAEYRDALAIRQKLAAGHPGITEFRSRLVLSHRWLGVVLSMTGEQSEAEAEVREAIALDHKLADDDPTFRSNLALDQTVLGNLLLHSGRPSQAEAECRAALAIRQKVADDHPTVADFRSSLASAHRSLGNLLMQTDRPSGAEAEYRAALAIQQKLADDNPAITRFRNSLADAHNILGNVLTRTGRPSGAEEEYRQALTIWQKMADDNPTVTDFRSSLALIHENIGWLLVQTGKPSEAEADHHAALALLRKLAEENPRDRDYRNRAANIDNNLSVVFRRLGRPAEALDHCERALAVREALVKEDPSETGFRAGLAENYLNRGLVRGALGDPAGAAADARRALALWDGLPSRSEEQWFFFACSHAALAGLADQAGSGVSAEEAASEADAAMPLLRKAAAMGYRSANSFHTDDALDPLRDRPDFRLLLMDLVMPSEPLAR
jgi:eukaryotic-like serine/threonine-protein kinase